MAGIYGADVAQLRALGKELNDASTAMAFAKRVLSAHVQASAAWKGADADNFRRDWNTQHRALLEKVIQDLASAGKVAKANADEQEKTSAVSGSGRAVGGAGQGNSNPDTPAGRADHSIPRHPDQGQADLSHEQLERLKGLVRDAGENNDLFEGNDNDVNELRDALADLKPAQLDQFLKTLSDDELTKLAEGSVSDGKGLFNWEGTTPFEKHQLLDQLLSKASPEQVDRLSSLIPWAQPDGQANGDAAAPGGAQGDASNSWLTPDSAVLGERQGKNDIDQGNYGTCVVMSAAGAIINNDPSWAKEHVTDNGNGTVSVKLYDKNGDGQWITVTKDLPAKEDGTLKGAQPTPGGNWPAYVEKALAQVYTDDDANDPEDGQGNPDIARPPGSYRAIEGNYGPDVSAYLTGTQGEQTEDADKLWAAAANGQPIIVTTQSEYPADPPVGYVAGHAFFVVGSKDGYIELQNPWRPTADHIFMSKDDFKSKFSDATIMAK